MFTRQERDFIEEMAAMLGVDKEEKHENVKDPGYGEAFEKLPVKEKAAIWDKRIAEIK